MFCKNCGKEILQTYKFCENCGVLLDQIGFSKESEVINTNNDKKGWVRKHRKALIILVLISIITVGVLSLTISNYYEDYLYEDYLDVTREQLEQFRDHAVQPAEVQFIQEQIYKRSPLGLKDWLPSVAYLECEDGEGYVYSGSGTVFHDTAFNAYTILTNLHVISDPWDGSILKSCSAYITPDHLNADDVFLVYAIDLPTFSLFDDFYDLVAFNLKEEFDIETQDMYNKLSELEGVVVNAKDITLCADIKTGDSLFISGYPIGGGGLYGGDLLTTTGGIVSGVDYDEYDRYFVTSAKVDSGSSGGLAILENGCFLRVPTAVLDGEHESLGRIMDVRKSKE